jgi:hypothetical protein
MASPAPNSFCVDEFLYDFTVNGGSVGAITLGSLPLGAVVTNLKGIVEVAGTSAGAATITLGSTTSATSLLASTALTLFDGVGDVVGQAVVPSLTTCNTANLATVVMTIGTAALTAGKIRFVVTYWLPSNVVLAS